MINFVAGLIISMKRESRYYEVSRKQIFLSVLIASLALTAVFNIGIYVGKRRVINAELKEEQQKLDNILSEIESIDFPISPNFNVEGQSEKKTKGGNLSESKKINSEIHEETHIREKNKVTKAEIVSKDKSVTKKKKYTVKIGTFTQRKNAEKLLNLIKSFGYESWIINDSDSQAFHVIVGKFNDIDLALSFGKELKTKHQFINGYIIKEFKDE